MAIKYLIAAKSVRTRRRWPGRLTGPLQHRNNGNRYWQLLGGNSMDRATHDVVDKIYEAALDDSKWMDCLESYGELTGSPTSAGLWIEIGIDVPLLIATTDEDALRPYEEYYATTFPDRFWSDDLRVGQIDKLEDFWDEGTYLKSE
ncbi:MAG: hypothetical protein VCC99_09845, partial [Alphaproteobacteria bacterium]